MYAILICLNWKRLKSYVTVWKHVCINVFTDKFDVICTYDNKKVSFMHGRAELLMTCGVLFDEYRALCTQFYNWYIWAEILIHTKFCLALLALYAYVYVQTYNWYIWVYIRVCMYIDRYKQYVCVLPNNMYIWMCTYFCLMHVHMYTFATYICIGSYLCNVHANL